MSQPEFEFSESELENPPRPQTPPVRGGFLIVLAVLGLLASLVYGGPYIAWRIGNAYESGRATAALGALKSLSDDSADFNKVSALFRLAQQAVAPAVANIRSITATQDADGLNKVNGTGLGSGVVIDAKNGYIVTNHHVIRDAERVFVRIGQSGDIPARILGTDPKTDLAVLKVGSQLTYEAAWGDSDKLDIGDWVLAIGSPFALERTVTAGIISAKNRTNLGIVGDNSFEDFLQTDAPINPGNSGGPLINLNGEVIGINTAIFSENGGNQGIGLAIPARLAKRIASQIIKDGKVIRGFFGIQIQSMNEATAREFGSTDGKGALVAMVMPGSPAASAGLKSGDVITKLGGESVTDSGKLRIQIASLEVGAKVAVEYLRDGKPDALTVTVGELADASIVPMDALGFTLIDQKADPADPKIPNILVIKDVTPSGPVANAGIRPGMRVLAVGRRPVNNRQEFQEAVARLNPTQGIPIRVQTRDGMILTVVLTLGGK
ncbi:MAG: trypsin-like peptidase domain-containing protein [Planctomycetota bacterium]|nr:trypsin-like peptidase domain-containing protein [Planctomycetota bacterium]